MAKVTSVSYGRLATFGRFENEKVSITLELVEGETADQALAQAQAWVEEKLGEREHLSESIVTLRNEHAQLEQFNASLKESVGMAARFMQLFQSEPQQKPVVAEVVPLGAMSEGKVPCLPDDDDEEESPNWGFGRRREE